MSTINTISSTIIGNTNETAIQIRNYFVEKGINARTVECNPIAIQYAAITDKPEAVLLSDKTDYLESLCKCIQFVENPPVLFIISTSDFTENNQKLCNLEKFENVQIINAADCNTLYSNLISCINAKSANTRVLGNNETQNHSETEETADSAKNMHEFLHEKITDALDMLDVTPNYNGYNCIREALKIAVQTPNRCPSVSKEIYPEVAKILSVTGASVERSIRTAIKRSWEKISDHNKLKFFGSYALKEGWSPTNGEYIAIVAEKLKRQYKIG